MQGGGELSAELDGGCGVERVRRRRRVGEGLEQVRGGEVCVGCAVSGERCCDELPRGVVLGKGQGTEEDPLAFGERLRAVLRDAGDAGGGSLFELLAHKGGIDAELLGSIFGEL